MTAPSIALAGPGGGLWIPPLKTSEWYWTHQSGQSTSGSLGLGTLRFIPAWWAASTLTSVLADIATAGAAGTTNLRLGMYADNGAGMPAALLWEFGSVAADTITPATLTGSWRVPYSGLWWWAAVVQGSGTQPVVRTVSTNANAIPIPASFGGGVPATGATNTAANCCYTQSGVTGALPATATVGGVGGSAARFLVKT